MNSCRIAICDDNLTDSAYVERFVNTWARERKVSAVVEAFPSAEAFLICTFFVMTVYHSNNETSTYIII